MLTGTEKCAALLIRTINEKVGVPAAWFALVSVIMLTASAVANHVATTSPTYGGISHTIGWTLFWLGIGLVPVTGMLATIHNRK